MQVISNIKLPESNYDTKLVELSLPEVSEARALLKKTIANLLHEHGNDYAVILAVRFVGRRVISLQHAENNAVKMVKLLDNKRHRLYYAIARVIDGKVKMKIDFMWNKLKHLSHEERAFLEANFNDNMFENHAKFLVEKSGGVVLENLIYRYLK